ncbi:FAD-containing oxidoreductase [Sphingomonas sp. ASY06-1R]|uniref:FAD-containing oxidoreductase n=1 Tax=Sphingomonas sp. ASY06-1R TaxID=3445771 RepID=UPI003FA1FA22
MIQKFDAIIVGAGQAGPALAGRLTASGMKVALIERHLVGGTCVNTGCKPTKTLIASAYAAHMARRGAEYGVTTGAIGIDMPTIAARAAKIIQDSRSSNEQWLAGMAGLTFVRGHARFEGPQTMRVGDDLLEAPKIFLNVGGRAVVPDLPGVHDVPFLTNSSIIPLQEVPEHLVIVGGSYIGLEFAQMYRRFGARVTVVEMGPRLIRREDPDISDAVRSILEGEGIEVRTDACCISLSRHPHGVAVGVECTEGAPEVVGSHVLLAVGRRPNTDDLGLDQAGVVMDAKGNIVVDDRLATNVPGIWALGDCNGRGGFTHTAWNDYEIVAANLLDGADRKLSDRILGYALYTDPPLGRVGMSEKQARASGRPLLISTRPMSRVGRAVEKAEALGFMKLVADADTKRILGAAILGTSGDEAIHGILDMMNADQPLETLIWAMPIHPTVSELIPTLVGDLRPV